PRKPGEEARVVDAGAQIMKVCAEVGGSISGEHGIGLEKADFMPFIFTAADLAFMQRLKDAFNPRGLCNPSKVFPTRKSCVEPGGGGSAVGVGVPPARAGLVLLLTRLSALVEREPGDLTATAQAGVTVAALQAALRARGQWLSLDPPDAARATLGGVLAANASGPRRHLYGTARDLLIGVTVVTADGAVVHGGGKVVQNVAGYDLPKLFIGSYGTL